MARDIRVTLELDNQKFNTQLNRSEQNVKGFERTSTQSFAKTALAAAGFATALAGVKKALTITAQFQDLRSSLSTVFGGLNEGADAFQRVTDIASRTQFQVQDITKAFIQLKGAGIEPTEDIIMTFANAAAITTDQLGAFQSAISLISRTTAGGLGLEELERLGDRGIPVYDILNEKLGLTRKRISEAGQSAEGAKRIIEALGDGINERFGSALDNRLQNTTQRFSNFNDQLSILADNLFGDVNTALGDAIGSLTNSLEALNKNIDAVKDFARFLGILAGIIAAGFGLKKGISLLGDFATKAGITSEAVRKWGINTFKAGTGIKFLEGASRDFGRASGKIPMVTEKITSNNKRWLFGVGRLLAGLTQITLVIYGVVEALKLYNRVLERRETKLIDAIVGDGRERVEQEIEALAVKVLDLTEAMNLYYETTRFSTRPVGITLGLQAAEIEKLQKRIDRLRESLKDMPETKPDDSGGGDDDSDAPVSTINQIQDAIKGLGEKLRDPANFNVFKEKLLAIKEELGDTFTVDEFKAYKDAVKDVEDAFDMLFVPVDANAEKLEEMEERFKDLVKEVGDVENFEHYEAVQDAINEALRVGDISLKQYQAAMEALSGSLSGAETRMAVFQNAIKDIDSAIANDLTNAIFEGENAIDSLKATFKEAIKQMIADTIRLMVIQTALQSIFGFFGYSATFNPSGGISDIAKKKQFGGPVMNNKPYIVGEDGPELFVPNNNGSIIPNNRMGGGSTNVTYNIQAVDAPSFQALIARDPDFIHAVASKGANNLPSGRRF